VGKTTIADRLIARDDFVRVITATTRDPRDGEVDGRDYHFLSRADFEAKIASGGFLEHALVHDNLYGVPLSGVEEAIASGRHVLLNIDVQGARHVRQDPRDLPLVCVFLVPPSLEVLEDRIRGRKTESEKDIQTRLANAKEELKEESHYDHSVVNDEIERAVEHIVRIANRAVEGVSDPNRRPR
jgi:guanylate kinase